MRSSASWVRGTARELFPAAQIPEVGISSPSLENPSAHGLGPAPPGSSALGGMQPERERGREPAQARSPLRAPSLGASAHQGQTVCGSLPSAAEERDGAGGWGREGARTCQLPCPPAHEPRPWAPGQEEQAVDTPARPRGPPLIAGSGPRLLLVCPREPSRRPRCEHRPTLGTDGPTPALLSPELFTLLSD